MWTKETNRNTGTEVHSVRRLWKSFRSMKHKPTEFMVPTTVEICYGRSGSSVQPSTAQQSTAFSNSKASSNKKVKLDDNLKLPFYKTLLNFRELPVAKASGLLQVSINCLYMSQVFYSSALLYLINKSIGCVEDGEIIAGCEATILNAKPGALVFSVNVSSRALMALFLFPMVGAAIDTTPQRRRRLLQFSGFLFVVLSIELLTVEDAWFGFLALDQLVIALTQLLYMIFYAYFLELRQDATTRLVVRFASESLSLGYLSQLLFMVFLVGITFVITMNTIELGRAGRLLALFWAGIPVLLAYRLYPNVPTLRQVPDERADMSWWNEGLHQLLRSVKAINEQHATGFKWFLLAVVFADATTQGTVALSAAFFTEFYGMQDSELGLVMLGISITFIFGARFSNYSAQNTDPIKSWKYSIIITTATLLMGLMGFFHKKTPFSLLLCWSVLIGFSLGWYYTSKLACFAVIAPIGNSTELGGIMSLFEVGLSWVPVLLCNVMVSVGVPYNWSLLPLCIFGVTGAIMISQSAPYKEVRIRSTSGLFGHECDIKPVVDNQDPEAPWAAMIKELKIPRS